MTDPTRSTRRQIITVVLLVFALIVPVLLWRSVTSPEGHD